MMNVIEKAHALSDHIHAMTKHAGGYGPAPEPDTEHARAIVEAYHQLLDENVRLHRELAVVAVTERIRKLDESCPALERWRELVLKSPRRSPLEKASAWEVTALVLESHGDTLGADVARENASDAIPPTATNINEVAA
jgi:hypothetical protein